MLVTALGLGMMTTLGPAPPIGRAASGCSSSGSARDVQLAQHGGDDGHRANRPPRYRRRRPHDGAEHRRGDLDRLVLAIVTAAVPKPVLFKIFSASPRA